MKIFRPTISSSAYIEGLVTSSTAVSNVVMYGTGGQLFITASSAIGGGGGGTGNGFPFTGTATISGSLIVTGSTTSTTGFTGSLQGTASWANNALTSSYAQTLTLQSTLTDFYSVSPSTTPGINNLFTKNTGSFTSAFGKYTIYSGSNSRAGEFVTSWNDTSVSYYDNSTVDIGNTSTITFTSAIVTGQVQISTGNTTPSGWQVKMLATFM